MRPCMCTVERARAALETACMNTARTKSSAKTALKEQGPVNCKSQKWQHNEFRKVGLFRWGFLVSSAVYQMSLHVFSRWTSRTSRRGHERERPLIHGKWSRSPTWWPWKWQHWRYPLTSVLTQGPLLACSGLLVTRCWASSDPACVSTADVRTCPGRLCSSSMFPPRYRLWCRPPRMTKRLPSVQRKTLRRRCEQSLLERLCNSCCAIHSGSLTVGDRCHEPRPGPSWYLGHWTDSKIACTCGHPGYEYV